MPNTAKALPRFIPTLTEVVQFQAPSASHAPAPHRPGGGGPASPEVPDEVRQRLDAALRPQLRSLVDEIVAAQLAEMRPRLVTEIDRLLQQKLSELVAAGLANPGAGEKPAISGFG